MKNEMISVIIPTLNRREPLERILSLIITEQTYRNFEIIVIDQSDSYNRVEEEKCLRSIIPNSIPFKYEHADIKSLPAARNRGINKSTGGVILFLDDDAEPLPGLFYQHLISYDISPIIGIISGRVIEKPDIHTNSRKLGGHISFTGRVFMNFNSDDSGFISYAAGCNMSLKKDVIKKIGYFDTGFIGTAQYEDADYCYRARKNGYKIFYNPKAVIKHRIYSTGGCRDEFSKREYFAFHNLGKFCRIHSLAVFFPVIILFQILRIIKKAIFYPHTTKERIRFLTNTLSGLIKGLVEGKKV